LNPRCACRTCPHVCVHVFVCSCVRVFVCSCVRVFVCSCVRVFVCSCVRVFVCSCVIVCMSLCAQLVCVCIYYIPFIFLFVHLLLHASRGCHRAQDCLESAVMRGEDGRARRKGFGSRLTGLVRNKTLVIRIAKVCRAVSCSPPHQR
jgi:hypothetical protein